MWNLHSLPEGLVAENCTCCALTKGTRTVLERASLFPIPFWTPAARQHVSVEAMLRANVSQGCLWSSNSASLPKLPIFPVSIFGQGLTKPLDAGFDAYAEIQRILGSQLKSIMSP